MGASLVHYSDVENAYDEPRQIGRLAGTIRALAGPDTLVCGTGDDTGPGVLSMATKGRQSLDFFDPIAPGLETFGNHDFDHGIDALGDIVRASPQTWLSANVETTDGDRFLAGETTPVTVERVGDLAVGFVGVLGREPARFNSGTAGLRITDPLAAVRAGADALRDRGVDRIVVLSHVGADDAIARGTDVDVILGGHVHSERVARIDGTLCTRPGVNGDVVFTVDLAGEPSATRHECADGPIDESVADAMRTHRAAAGLDEVVGTVDEPIERTHATAYGGESRIGNFVADAYRWIADADVGLQNSGGIREGPPLSGTVTVADLVSVVPFEEPVAVAALTGAELTTLVSQSNCAAVSFGDPGWWNGHFSGCSVRYDVGADELVDLRVDGDPVDPERTYTVATTDYLFETDAEFPVLSPDRRRETLDLQYEALAAYARERGIDPEIEGRLDLR